MSYFSFIPKLHTKVIILFLKSSNFKGSLDDLYKHSLDWIEQFKWHTFAHLHPVSKSITLPLWQFSSTLCLLFLLSEVRKGRRSPATSSRVSFGCEQEDIASGYGHVAKPRRGKCEKWVIEKRFAIMRLCWQAWYSVCVAQGWRVNKSQHQSQDFRSLIVAQLLLPFPLV